MNRGHREAEMIIGSYFRQHCKGVSGIRREAMNDGICKGAKNDGIQKELMKTKEVKVEKKMTGKGFGKL